MSEIETQSLGVDMLSITFVLSEESKGLRLDRAISDQIDDYSRARIQGWMKTGELKVNGSICKPKDKTLGGEQIELKARWVSEHTWQAEALPIHIVYEDESILVINKSPDVVVHPAPGHWQGTLVNALLHHCPQLEYLPRAGIVHRLDKDTSGLLVVAKRLNDYNHLVQQLQARRVKRVYHAIVHGVMISGGVVRQPIGRHRQHRTKMAVVAAGKPAVTHYRVLQRFERHTWVRLQLETGRTHQIRVHMAHLGYPIVGDAQYGGRKSKAQQTCLFGRQALHAKELGFVHPSTQKMCTWEVPLADDINQLLHTLSCTKVRHRK